jgi:hypothetical protein
LYISVGALLSGTIIKSMGLGYNGPVIISLWIFMLILFISTLEVLKKIYDGKCKSKVFKINLRIFTILIHLPTKGVLKIKLEQY